MWCQNGIVQVSMERMSQRGSHVDLPYGTWRTVAAKRITIKVRQKQLYTLNDLLMVSLLRYLKACLLLRGFVAFCPLCQD